ncbi:nucleoside-diphosphate kinase [bacterium]|nr:nucleoside-diphosphate kinase [bacterium]
MHQKSLIILKPDAYQRKLVGEIINRIERKGLKLVAMKLMRITEELAKQHYAPHKDKDFFAGLISYIKSGPVLVLVVEGAQAIPVMRKLVGATCGYEAEPGTIRGDYSISLRYNLIHASDSEESSAREIDIFFRPEEIIDEPMFISPWVDQG